MSIDDREAARRSLVRLLQMAYSGELAASHAYQGHARSVRDPKERARITEIENEEWVHRECVGKMLASLDAGPDSSRERWLLRIGKTIGFLCRIGGWLIPMYGAGRLESHNVKEYEDAARFARACGREDIVDDLLHMAEVEWEHERYFRERVESRRLGRMLPMWKVPPAKDEIRASYAALVRLEGPPGAAG